MADIEPITIRVDDEPGSSVKRVCMTVLNSGPLHAGTFNVALRVDGNVPPEGIYTISGLASGTTYLACVRTTLLATGQHTIAMSIDDERAIREYNETNNFLELPYSATPSKAGAPSVDLTVSAIKVNGQVPDGEEDCKPGKNSVTVTVKNGGKDAAGLFTTRLTVDGVDVAEQSAVDLPSGQEQEIRFEGVQLKNGEHTLTVLADANSQVAETGEANNVRTVTARC
jgi:subtilase family serine protease